MGTMTIRNIDESLRRRLRTQAAAHGRSMEEEARDILPSALSTEGLQADNLADAILRRFQPMGGVEIDLAPREAMRSAVDFS